MSNKETSGPRAYTASGWHSYTPASDTPSGAVGEFHGYVFGSGTDSLPNPSTSIPTDAIIPSQLQEEVKRLTAEATRLAAEAARLQAEVTRLSVENAELKEVVKNATSKEKMIDQETARMAKLITGILPKESVVGGGEQTMLICERIGCLSLDFWVGMSERQKGELDVTLENIVKLVSVKSLNWADTGDIIRNELARVGIRLATDSEFRADQAQAWTYILNTSMPVARRMGYLLIRSSMDIGVRAYSHEIIHFFKRLVELRLGISTEKVIDEEAVRKAKLIAGILPKESVTGGDEQTMLICERVGCLSLDFWVGMSERQKGELDVTLENIMKLVAISPTWADRADVIRTGLERIGIRLATNSEFCADQSEAWNHVKDTSLPISKRMGYVLNSCSMQFGEKAYPHEMVHFFKQLVELRRDGLDSNVTQPAIALDCL